MVALDTVDLFSGALLAPILTLDGKIPSIGPHTGTASDGSWSLASCADWETDEVFAFGTVGLEGSTSSTWLESTLCPCCQEERPILCVEGSICLHAARHGKVSNTTYTLNVIVIRVAVRVRHGSR
jgi:hypothetical protein